ncbi:F0F1 ATP synthase subunit delta [Candidatus Roizmanbacteria bacterium]|nr:F0F1 ATP synthase subunit delta [Candidatus Roizmanbacteria bacterium]
MDFSDFFKTKTQANDFLAGLAKIAEMAYQTNFDLEKALMEQFGLGKKDKFLSFIRENNLDLQSASNIKAFLTKLQDEVTNLSIMPITLAFEPKEQTLKALSDWFQVNLKKQVLFEIAVDKKLIAGATITFKGKFKDFSIKEKFNEIVKNSIIQK